MRFAIAALMSVSALLSPITAFAQSADIDGTIVDVSAEKAQIKLDDGQTYSTPPEFNFEGLTQGVKVSVFYTVEDGKRVVDDIEIIE